jgi:hypothetical protein
VATTISAPPRRPSICGLIDTPPNTIAAFSRRGSAGSKRAHRLAHLRGQLARGHQHQHAGAPGRLGRLVAELLQQRQHERRRLAGAGLRGAQHIAPAQDLRNGGRLDGGGLVQAQHVCGARQGGGESEFNKRHGPV